MKKMEPQSALSVTASPSMKMNFPDDIIIFGIQPKLPVKSLFRFKAVSKRYGVVISDPKWAHNASGLETSLLHTFPKRKGQLAIQTKNISYVTLPEKENHKILGSSNGLILAYFLRRSDLSRVLCVSNPLTKQLVELPNHSTIHPYDGIYGIASKRDQSSFIYKIVLIENQFSEDITIKTRTHVFSSDTGSWTTWNDLTCPKKVFTDVIFSYKGILHWQRHSRSDEIITYDPFNSPDRFGQISFKVSSSSCQNVIYWGEQEALRFIRIKRLSDGPPCSFGLDWCRFVDYDKGEWRQTHHSLVITNTFPICIYNPKFFWYLLVDLDFKFWGETTQAFVDVNKDEDLDPLIVIEYCPWSSPSFYVAPR